MRILSIETSCDESAIAIIESVGDFPACTINVLANKTISQIDIHKEFGGVFPAVAKREHAKALVPLLVQTLKQAGLYKETSRHVVPHPLSAEFEHLLEREPQLYLQFIETIPSIDAPAFDAIAVTMGPGLEPALWVGINFAKALSMIWKVPVIPINHMEGHLCSSILSENTGEITIPEIVFPAIGLLVSGGHTELILMEAWGKYTIIGQTRDDAVGEAFDKVARLLGLPYPGGPEISKQAELGVSGVYTLPRPMLHSDDFDFSFAGLKTAVRYLVQSLGTLTPEMKQNVAKEFQSAAIEVLLKKSLRAIEQYQAQTFILGGGVSANTYLRAVFTKEIHQEQPQCTFYCPNLSLSTDNALMIAVAGLIKENQGASELSDIRARGGWKVADPALPQS